MGHKKRARRVNERAPSPRHSEVSHEELAIQAMEMHQLLQNRTACLQKAEDNSLCYLVSTLWLEEWKAYVGYHKLLDDTLSEKKIGKRHPGKINLTMLAAPGKHHLIPPELEEYQFLNDHLTDHAEYMPVTKEIWEGFATRYDHVTVRRPIRKTKNNFYQSETIQCEMVVVDVSKLQGELKNKNKKDYLKSVDSDYIEIPDIWKYEQLELFLKRYCLVKYDREDIRIWKGYSYLGSNPICLSLLQSIAEEYFRVKGNLLLREKLQKLDTDQFLKSSHLVIVEIGEALVQEDEGKQIEGYCEECVQKKRLGVHCACGLVHYCSEKCKIDDMVFHQHTCQRVFESDDDEDYAQPLHYAGESYVYGLENIGNTCFMNSTFQCLLSIDFLREFFCANAYMEAKDPKQEGVLLEKVSKLMKKCGEGTVIPWSLKGQIDYFFPPFRGYKQHDASDFLIHLLNGVNEMLWKEESSIYSQLFKDNFIGTFVSKVTCPTCVFENVTNEIFMQITLPIKRKAHRETCDYCIVKDCVTVVKGKTQIKETWGEMKRDLSLAEDCVIGFVRGTAQVISVIQEEESPPDKHFKKNKNEVCFYPQVSKGECSTLITLNLVSIKKILSNNIKSKYGSSVLVGLQPKLNTLGTVWLTIVRYFFPEGEIYDQAFAIKNHYFAEMDQQVMDRTNASSTIGNEKEAEKQQKQEQQLIQKHNKRLQQFIEKVGIAVYVCDLKKKKGVCRHCNRKCDGCALPMLMERELESFFQQNQFRFEVSLKVLGDLNTQEVNLTSSGDATIAQCLQLFKEPQTLDEQNAWYCSICDGMRLAQKQMQIACYPKVLILQLSRFKTEGNKKVKNNDPIVYREVEVLDGREYGLLGVIVHEGSMEGGHYWSICKRGGKFYTFNDSKVMPTNKIVNKGAYVLVYMLL